MRIWSYTCINRDLLYDDPSSAEGVFPLHAYSTREKAEKVLLDDMLAEDEELMEDSDEDAVRTNPVWTPDHRGGFKCWTYYHEMSDTVYYLYEMELEEG